MDLPSELAATPGTEVGSDAPAPAVAVRPGGFDAWVGQAGPDLMRFAQVTSRGLDPADLVQDALVAVFTRWSRLTGPGQVDAYARRVVLNSHISRWRRWGKRVSPIGSLEAVEAPAGYQTAVEDVLTAQNMLGSLPVTQRAAVFLRFYDDLTYAQIAGILGCREPTARSHVHRALTQLKRELEKDTSE